MYVGKKVQIWAFLKSPSFHKSFNFHSQKFKTQDKALIKLWSWPYCDLGGFRANDHQVSFFINYSMISWSRLNLMHLDEKNWTCWDLNVKLQRITYFRFDLQLVKNQRENKKLGWKQRLAVVLEVWELLNS